MSKAYNCKNCNTDHLLQWKRYRSLGEVWIHCDGCGQTGPVKTNMTDAGEAWNDQQIVVDVTNCSPSVSIGARMWVQTVRDLKLLFELLPVDDVTDVMELIKELWVDDPERVTAAERALYEIIDNPPGKVTSIQ